MMHRTVHIFLLGFLLMTGIQVGAQQKGKEKGTPATGDKKAHHIFLPPVYLGNSDYTHGPLKKDVLNNLLKQGLTSHDSLGNRYRIVGFDFGYAERKLYEDSVGNLLPMTDYLSQHCKGATLPADLTETKNTAITNYLDGAPDSSDVTRGIYERIKTGDTLYFDNVLVAKYMNATESRPDSSAILARGMKFWIVK